MIKKFRHELLLSVWIACALSIGFIIAINMKGILKESGWAEVTSAAATVIALVLAIATFISWKQQKIREDAYSTTKMYVSILAIIETTTVELANLFYSIVPAAGMIPPSDHQATKTLDEIQEKNSYLILHSQKLILTKSELPFWGVSLSPQAEADHDLLIETLNSYLNPLHHLHNSLTNYYIHKVSDNTFNQWWLGFNNKHLAINDLFNKRKSMNMHSMFNI